MKYSKDKNVAFDADSHVYTYKKKRLVSVTTFIERFKNKFDSDYHSKRIAEQSERTQQEVLNEWSEKGKRSCEIGTAIHKIFEDYTEGKYCFNNGKLEFDYLPLPIDYIQEFEEKAKVAIKFIEDFFITGRLIPVHSEFIVYNDTLAGQIDMIAVNGKGEYFIIDFKTNHTISQNGYGKTLSEPLANYPDCNFYHYSLQLSIYKQMSGYDIKAMCLIHVLSDGYKVIECEDIFETIKFNDLCEQLKQKQG